MNVIVFFCRCKGSAGFCRVKAFLSFLLQFVATDGLHCDKYEGSRNNVSQKGWK